MSSSVKQTLAPSAPPSPAVRRRDYDQDLHRGLVEAGLSPLVARVAAARLQGTVAEALAILRPSLRDLPSPWLLTDMERAADRVAQAIILQEEIGLCTDYDVDGITSHAVLWTALTHHFRVPPEKVHSFIGHRLRDGYGVSDEVAQRILSHALRPSLVITADQGSSDEARIRSLKQAGLDVIVTDHHEPPVEGVTQSAHSVVNPKRAGDSYPDKHIAGVMVAWLLVAAVRQKLILSGYLAADSPSVGALLDYVALGSVADCINLGESASTRAVILAGLRHIRRGVRPCWRAFLCSLGEKTVSAETLAFTLAPRINARSRLDDPLAGLHYLVSDSDAKAWGLFQTLSDDNLRRRAIEKELNAEAHQKAAQLVGEGYQSLAIALDIGHSGVHGISASRIKEAWGRPTVVFSAHQGHPSLLHGSARSIEGVHIRDALQQVADTHPEIIPKFGGHAGAAGLTLVASHLDLFRDTFEAAVTEQLGGIPLEPVVLSDGPIASQEISLETVSALSGLEPFGKDFDAPLFEARFTVRSVRPMGEGQHLRLMLSVDAATFEAVWFNAQTIGAPLTIQPGESRLFVFALSENRFRGEVRLQLVIRHAN